MTVIDTHALDRGAILATFWTHTPDELCADLQYGKDGLSMADAATRLTR